MAIEISISEMKIEFWDKIYTYLVDSARRSFIALIHLSYTYSKLIEWKYFSKYIIFLLYMSNRCD